MHFTLSFWKTINISSHNQGFQVTVGESRSVLEPILRKRIMVGYQVRYFGGKWTFHLSTLYSQNFKPSMPRTNLGLGKAFASFQGKAYNIVYKYNIVQSHTMNSGKKSFIHFIFFNICHQPGLGQVQRQSNKIALAFVFMEFIILKKIQILQMRWERCYETQPSVL